MNPQPPNNRLRMLRRSLGLTQAQLAYLLGYDGHTQVARLEEGSKDPLFVEALVMELVFGVPAEEIFPEAIERSRRLAMRRLRVLRQCVPNTPGRLSSIATRLARIMDLIKSHAPASRGGYPPWLTNRDAFDSVERFQ